MVKFGPRTPDFSYDWSVHNSINNFWHPVSSKIIIILTGNAIWDEWFIGDNKATMWGIVTKRSIVKMLLGTWTNCKQLVSFVSDPDLNQLPEIPFTYPSPRHTSISSAISKNSLMCLMCLNFKKPHIIVNNNNNIIVVPESHISGRIIILTTA